MNKNLLIRVGISLITCLLAVLYSHSVLSRPLDETFRLFFLMSSISIAFVEPFAGLIECLIFIYFRPQEFFPGLVKVPLMLIIESLTLAFMLIQMAGRRSYGRLFKVPQDFLMLWFFVAIGLSNLANLYIGGITDSLIGFSSTLILYFLIVHLVNTPGRLKLTMNVILVLTIILATQGIVQHFTGVGLGGQTMIKGRIRGLGIFADPNDLGLAMLIVIPLLFFTFLGTRKLFKKLLTILGIGLLAYALFLTISRGSILSLALLTLLLLAKMYGKVGIAAGIFILAAIYLAGPSRLGQVSVDDTSAFGRVESWTIGFGLFKSNPIFGVGAHRFTDYHFLTAHNSFILCASELGLFGLFPWVMLFVLSMRNNYFIQNQDSDASTGELHLYANSILYGLAAFAFASFFLSRTYNELLYILVGLSVSVANLFTAKSTDSYRLWEKADFAYTSFIIIGLFVMTYAFLRFAWLIH